MFRLLSEVTLVKETNASADSSNRGLYLTLDTDWCHERILVDTLQILESHGARATIFCTDQSKSLDLLHGNPNIELGIHPNFRPLLDGKVEGKGLTAEKILDDMLSVVPSAKCVRSHSLISGSNLTALFVSRRLTHESNLKIPFAAASNVRPFAHPTGMVMCPFQWGDYSEMTTSIPLDLAKDYLVVNFHPIHVFLNSKSLHAYERTRSLHYAPEELIKYRYKGRGVRTVLLELLQSLSTLKSHTRNRESRCVRAAVAL